MRFTASNRSNSQCARTDVKIRIGGRHDKQQDGRVDNIGQDTDVGTLNGKNEGRGGRRCSRLGGGEKIRIAVDVSDVSAM